jgi:hypothetical protein
MRAPRLISGIFAVVCLGLSIGHLMNLPVYPIGDWIAAPRVTKSAAFDVSSLPSDVTDYSWTSLWGRNRPSGGRAHEIMSELEIFVQHETRSGLVTVRVTGDSEAEVDGFIETIRHDFDRTYRQGGSINDPVETSHFHSSSDTSEAGYYWRQKYLWLLGTSFLVSTLVTLMLPRTKNQKAEQGVGGQPATRRDSEIEP